MKDKKNKIIKRSPQDHNYFQTMDCKCKALSPGSASVVSFPEVSSNSPQLLNTLKLKMSLSVNYHCEGLKYKKASILLQCLLYIDTFLNVFYLMLTVQGSYQLLLSIIQMWTLRHRQKKQCAERHTVGKRQNH